MRGLFDIKHSRVQSPTATEEFSQLLPIYRENHLHVCSTPKNIRGQQSQNALISVQAKAGGCHSLDVSSNEYLIHRVPREPT